MPTSRRPGATAPEDVPPVVEPEATEDEPPKPKPRPRARTGKSTKTLGPKHSLYDDILASFAGPVEAVIVWDPEIGEILLEDAEAIAKDLDRCAQRYDWFYKVLEPTTAASPAMLLAGHVIMTGRKVKAVLDRRAREEARATPHEPAQPDRGDGLGTPVVADLSRQPASPPSDDARRAAADRLASVRAGT